MKFLLVDTGKTKTVSVIIDEKTNIYGFNTVGPADIFLNRKTILEKLSPSIIKLFKNDRLGIDEIDILFKLSWTRY